MVEVREHREDILRRVPLLRLAFVALLVAIGSSYWFVQVVQGSHYRQLAEHNRLKRVPVRPTRGLIYDRHGRLLVDNVPSYNLVLDRSRMRDAEGSLAFAAGILEEEPAQLADRVERFNGASPFVPLVLAENLSLSQVARFLASNLEYPEFEIDVAHLRIYRPGHLTAHALGYIGEVTPADLASGQSDLRPGELIGKRSAERSYDEMLRGTEGERRVVVDSRGRVIEEFGSQEAKPGERLDLTLDLELQQHAVRYFEGRVGAAVALDPRNGEILVLLSAPSYDPNLFTRRMNPEEWRKLVEAPNKPLQNRALRSTYSPGSIFKIVVAVAGLSEGVVDTGHKVRCVGGTTIYNRRFRCWRKAGHGWVDLRTAIKESCDVYFYHLGQALGIERIARYARLFGLGKETGVDFSAESAGLVPDLEWSLTRRGYNWYPGETISVAIGQGPLLATPLQLASMMATVANGGYRIRPHLKRGVAADWPRERLEIDAEALGLVREALWAVVNEQGTGARAFVPGYDVAGKTGTVQVIEQKTWTDSADMPFEHRDHAWFASFAPLDDPELVVLVFVEHGGRGSSEAAPLARKIYEEFRVDPRHRRPA